MNCVSLSGSVVRPAEFSHESHGMRYYQIEISSRRLSGVEDVLRALISENELRRYDPCVGDMVELDGQLRSFNNKSGVGSRLVISVFAQNLRPGSGESINRVELEGVLCKAPIYRKTPLGREICDLLIAVPRAFGKSDYLPVICWGRMARDSADYDVGARLSVKGRFQSRTYIKQLENSSVERVAFEVSASFIGPTLPDVSENEINT